MDRRFFLAIVLIVGVVLLVPRLYMRIFPPPPGAVPAADSVRATTGDTVAAPPPAAVTADTGRTAAPVPSATTAGPAATVAPRVDTAVAPAAAPAETTVVRTGLATFAFSSYGAAPASVTLTEYESLRERGRGVTLTPAGTPLASYRLLVAGD